MREITHLVIHAAATRPSQDIGAEDIRRWHKAQGWADIGYHYVIRRNGCLEYGRPLEQPGAHVSGHNARTIGICLVGGVALDGKTPQNNYTDDQWETLRELLRHLKTRFPKAEILGHRDFPGVAKACPSFSVKEWLKENPL